MAETTSQIDPVLRPYLETGLQRAQELFLTGAQPTFFPRQTFVSPSEQTLAALTQQEEIARAASPALQAAQQAYTSSLGQIGTTAAGGFLGGSPYRDQLIAAATRPLTQQFESQVIPGISSLFSRAGRYGSGAMEQALGRATESYGRALGDVSASLAAQDYARERGLQQQAQVQQAALAQAAPSFFQMGFLPAQSLATVGAAREAIAARPLQEEITRFNFEQQVPRESLMSFLSSVYGSPLRAYGSQTIPQAQTNPLGQAIGGAGLGYLGGQFLTNQFGANAPLYGAGIGAVLGGLL
jgi:hypothetical protein